MSTATDAAPVADEERLPWAPLLALSAAGFLAIVTETIPAGLLPQLSSGLRVSESAAGQLVTVYALGSVVAAIPLVVATRRLGRKTVLLSAVGGLLVFNAITSIAPWYPAILAARFVAGGAAALVWSVLVGYARGLVSSRLQGRAMAIAGTGQPIALAVGVPIGAWTGSLIDWRWVFAIISAAAAALMIWIMVAMRDVPGHSGGPRMSLARVVAMPGIRSVLVVALVWVLAHNVLYTYIAPLMKGTGVRLDLALAIFGVASFVSITAVGLVIDRALRASVIASAVMLTAASVGLANPTLGAVAIGAAVAVWGISFGGAPVLLQTALADRAGEHTDAAQSVFVMVFNLAVAGGGLLGGAILAGSTAPMLGWAAAALAIAVTIFAATRTSAFPGGARP